jgi:uncharacterized protein (TIGR00730 family)
MRVCVYCGSSFGSGDDAPRFIEVAAALGEEMARRGIGLVYGGGKVGLMGVVADAVIGAGGEAVGIIPSSMVANEVAHDGLTELFVVDSMHARKAMMADLANGFVTLPGGFGTLDETFEILTWNQLGLVHKPLVLLDVDGFWASLFDQIQRMIDAGLVRPQHRRLAQRATTVAEALDIATGDFVAPPPKWADRTPKS